MPPIVRSPSCAPVPTTKVPAVMADRSDESTVNVPPAEPTVIDVVPFGRRETVLVPALTVPEKATSFAVMVMAELVLEMDVEPALVTLPVPSVVIVTPVVPVAFAFRVIAPLDPEEVCNTKELPERALDAVMVPLAVSVSVPLVDVTAPVVPMVAEVPVVVMERLPPTIDVSIIVLPALVTKPAPLPPVLTLKPAPEV